MAGSRDVAVLLGLLGAAGLLGLVFSGHQRGIRSTWLPTYQPTWLPTYQPASVPSDPSPQSSLRDENEQLKRQIEELKAHLARQKAQTTGAVGDAAVGGAAAARSKPKATAGFNASLYPLTPERIKAHCDKDNIILVTFVNYKRADYAYTWDAHLRRLRLTNYLIGALDTKALELLVARKIPAFDMDSGLTTADYGWGTKTFRQLGLRKTELIIRILSAGADLILTDADALITRDPSPYVRRFLPEAQVLVTSDHLMSTTAPDDDGLEVPERAHPSAWNIGYFYLSHTVLSAMQHWQEMCVTHPTLWDQNLFKDVLKIGGLQFIDSARPSIRQKRLFLGYNRTVVIGILPVSTFCSGHTYFVQQMPQRRRVEPYSVHTTFQYSGAPGKTHRLREGQLWEDDPPYYDPPEGFIVYRPDVRRELTRPAGIMDVGSHFSLINHQLRQIRAAFLLAEKLKRILILPPLVCGLDRFWAPHNGTIPGSNTKLPVDPCPADHVLDLEGLSRARNLTSTIREYSFLTNPRLPAKVRDSIRTLPPPPGLGDELLKPLLELGKVRVLNFSSMPDLFQTLDRRQQLKAQERMRTWTSLWCCSKPPTPKAAGHIFYDMFWDMIPHTDKVHRVWDKPWEPTYGP